jgi:Zn-dependent protease
MAEIRDLILLLLSTFLITLFSMILHEIAHGLVALWQGDHTARLSGRLSLNPLKHIDPWMTIIVPLILALSGGPIFGGAKPVPVNTRNLKHGEWSMALVAIAGPLTNILLAFLSFLLWIATDWDVCVQGVAINLGFAVFNIIPIPPLDGSRVLYALAPDGARRFMEQIEAYGTIIIYALILIGGTVFTSYILNGRLAILNAFYWIIGVH